MTNPPTSAIFNDLETEKKKKNTKQQQQIHCIYRQSMV